MGPRGSTWWAAGCPSCLCDQPDGRRATSDRSHLGRYSRIHPAPRGRCRGLLDQARPTGTPDRGRMIVDGRGAVTARAWHIAPGDRPPPATGEEQTAPPPVPPRPTPQHFYPDLDDWGYGRSIEW